MTDEVEPTCGQCSRLGRSCPGTQGPTLFIDESARFDSDRGSSDSQSTSKSPSKSPNLPPPSEDVASITSSPSLSRAQNSACTEPASSVSRWHLDLPIEVHYISLLVNKLRINKSGDGSGFSWLRSGLDNNTVKLSVSHLFTRNLAQAFFGHYHHLPEVMANARVEYGKHLLILKKQLNTPSSVNDFNMFHGIMAAVVYEFVVMTSPDAWGTHVLALAKIMQSRGPEAYQEMPERATFGMCRVMIVGHAMQKRTRTFLEEPQWKISGPWLLPDALQDKLTDVQVYMPGLLEDYDNSCDARLSPGAKSIALTSVLKRVITQINHLFAWRWEWERQHQEAVRLVPCSPSSCVPRNPLTGEPLFPSLIYYSSFMQSHEMARYNSTLVVLFDLARDICGDDSYLLHLDRLIPVDLRRTSRRSPLCLPSDPEVSLLAAAEELVRSVEYALSEEAHIAASGLYLLLSLNSVYRALPVEQRHLRGWIRRVCRQIGTLSGFSIGVDFDQVE
ncbi:MAG: hypothetical protein Q9219_004099 [cf. Caloplaca sp. 3 TL-2023]